MLFVSMKQKVINFQKGNSSFPLDPILHVIIRHPNLLF